MNIVFFGTPKIAVQCLEKILQSKHKVLAVVTNADKIAGRGKKLIPSEVKQFALKNDIPVLEYEKIKAENAEDIKNFNPDALVLVAFGQLLPEKILQIATPINMHGSLLPALRGASPIQTAILNGLTETGATIMKMEKGMDTGDILLQEKIKIDELDTSETLFNKFGEVGGKMLCTALDILENGEAKWQKQDNSKATFTAKFTKESGKICFNDTSKNIVNKIRAYNPNPVAYFVYNNENYKVFSAKNIELESNKYQIGEIVKSSSKEGLIIKTQDGFVEILELQAPSSKKMPAKVFLNGKKIEIGTVLN